MMALASRASFVAWRRRGPAPAARSCSRANPEDLRSEFRNCPTGRTIIPARGPLPGWPPPGGRGSVSRRILSIFGEVPGRFVGGRPADPYSGSGSDRGIIRVGGGAQWDGETWDGETLCEPDNASGNTL